MKRTIYIGAFTFLLLVKDFDRYNLGSTWGKWYMVHHVAGVALFAGGISFGFWQGKHWWRVMYVEKRRWRKL